MNKKGFTLIETVIVVAIMAITSAFSIVAIYNMTDEMKITELDGCAREIFVAAQNRLSAMKMNGSIDELVGPADRPLAGTIPGNYPSVGLCYLSSDDSKHKDALDQLLLQGGMESGIRSESYVIEFDPSQGLIYGVFFAQQSFVNEYLDDGANPVFLLRNDRDVRIAAKVGYYGSDATSWNPDTPGEVVAACKLTPTVTITNSEKLLVKIRCDAPTEITDEDEKSRFYQNLVYTITLSGPEGTGKITLFDDLGYDSNGQIIKKIEADQDAAFKNTSYFVQGGGAYIYTVELDSLEVGKGFFDLYSGGVALKPGSDITITVKARCTTEFQSDISNHLSILPGEASGVTNCLFASVNGMTASIENGRHLQNLDQLLKAGNVIYAANLGKNVDWKTTQDTYGSNFGFVPINDTPLLTLDGRSCSIKNLQINTSSSNFLGLFATLIGTTSKKRTIKNLNMDECTVAVVNQSVVKNSAAGILAGKMQYVTVTGCDFKNCQVLVQNWHNAGILAGDFQNSSFMDCNVRNAYFDVQSVTNVGAFTGRMMASTADEGMVEDSWLDVASGENIGIFVGYGNGENGGAIRSCVVTKSSIFEPGSSVTMGGFAGKLSSLSLTDCNVVNSSIFASITMNAGLFVGDCMGSAGKMSNLTSCEVQGGRLDVKSSINTGLVAGNVSYTNVRESSVRSYNDEIKLILPELNGDYNNVGGFAGNVLNSSFTNCFSAVNNLNSGSSGARVGGFLGAGANVSAVECYSSVIYISANDGDGSFLGGFAGNLDNHAHDKDDWETKFKYNFASVGQFACSTLTDNGKMSYIGGFAGNFQGSANYCYSAADLSNFSEKGDRFKIAGFGFGSLKGEKKNLCYLIDAETGNSEENQDKLGVQVDDAAELIALMNSDEPVWHSGENATVPYHADVGFNQYPLLMLENTHPAAEGPIFYGYWPSYLNVASTIKS